ncbi:hypothetical protein [Rhizobium ruizarguesonis]|uniref:hypothetical protein n=1 Tax=Rhizobium ruizarguesonis TaxID=2081791 RepID=UPI001FEF6C10|nr:hypothetical protein [Rhizobium ruizarguesonis]
MNTIATGVSADLGQNKFSEKTKKKLAGAKAALQSTFGQVVFAMSSVPRYRSQMLSDLHHLVVDPLINDRIALARVHDGQSLPRDFVTLSEDDVSRPIKADSVALCPLSR